MIKCNNFNTPPKKIKMKNAHNIPDMITRHCSSSKQLDLYYDVDCGTLTILCSLHDALPVSCLYHCYILLRQAVSKHNSGYVRSVYASFCRHCLWFSFLVLCTFLPDYCPGYQCWHIQSLVLAQGYLPSHLLLCLKAIINI